MFSLFFDENGGRSRLFLMILGQLAHRSRLFLSFLTENGHRSQPFLLFSVPPAHRSHHFAKCRLNTVGDCAPFILKLYERPYITIHHRFPRDKYLIEPQFRNNNRCRLIFPKGRSSVNLCAGLYEARAYTMEACSSAYNQATIQFPRSFRVRISA